MPGWGSAAPLSGGRQGPAYRRPGFVGRKPGRLALIAVLLGAGCAGSGIRENPDGTLSIECSGGYHDWSRCHDRAAGACPDGRFEIVSRVSDEGSSNVGSRDWSAAGSEVTRMLQIRCR